MSFSLPEGKVFINGEEVGTCKGLMIDYDRDNTYEQPRRSYPQVSGAYRAWRLWRLTEDDQLQGLVKDYIWTPGENAVSDPLLKSFSLRSTTCGFYGVSTLGVLWGQERIRMEDFLSAQSYRLPGHRSVSYALGTSLHYGRMVRGQRGVRSEKALPEYLALSEDEDFNLRLIGVAEKYKMKLISLDEADELPTGYVDYVKPEVEGD